ncbi:glycosyltransferase family 9 protein, partial [Streptomyces iakyrus]|uniref:glycosyltransferase family 9 protein n=1 Tax=Streptomyces iakyrus TaxID=68219 RepID=UPI00346B60FD
VLVRLRVRIMRGGGRGHGSSGRAVGTPVVSLFAPVVPAERWAPYGVPHVLLGDPHAACADTRARHCPVPGHPCLDGIGDAEVLAAVAALTDHPADRGEHTQRGAAV